MDKDELSELIRHAAEHGADPAVMEVVRTLADRLKKAEAALDEINPGWTYGGHFHCSCAACET